MANNRYKSRCNLDVFVGVSSISHVKSRLELKLEIPALQNGRVDLMTIQLKVKC